MNWQHLQAFCWLRWRLLVNQWRRAGTVNAVLMMIVAIGALVTAVPSFIACFMVGLYVIPKAAPLHLMLAWDALIVGFLFFWSIGLVTELQRTEPISLSKFLHLPVSVNGVFLINYMSSLVRLSMLVCAPVMLAFSLALISVKGVMLLPVLPLLAAFVLMVTALTYQFQGWLGSLMSNPRHRRTVIVVMTGTIILISQLPNLLNMLAPWGRGQPAHRSTALRHDLAKLDRDFKSQEFEARDDVPRQQKLRREHRRLQQQVRETHERAAQQADREREAHWEHLARLLNMSLPVGWLPLGVMSAAEGRLLPSSLGLLGMTLIGTASLWRSYVTTVRQYQGQSTNRNGRRAPQVATSASAHRPRGLLIEARLPGLSEPVSAIALGGLRSLVRAPEAKMMLLTPVIGGPIFGSLLFKVGHTIPESVRPLIAIGGMAFVLLGVLQLMGNQFGFDRDGFRVFVLCAAPRRDILFGKNLAFAPLVLGIAAILLPIVQMVCPMRLDHFLSMVPQYLSMYLLFCIFANFVSIYAPVYMAAGSLKAASPKFTTILLQLVMFMLIFPLTQSATLLPVGIEAGLGLLGWAQGVPICLLLSLAECVALLLIYRLALDWQGGLLQGREQKILESVTNRAP